MTERTPEATEVATAARPQSWGLVLLALAAFLIVPTVPSAFQSIIPITETLVLLAGALAVCATLGWLRGGNAILALVWIGISAYILWNPIGAGSLAYQELIRGWTLLLMASFGVVSIFTPTFGLVNRGIVAVLIAMAGAIALAFANDNGMRRVQDTMRQEYTRRTEIAVGIVRDFSRQPVVQRAIERSPSFGESLKENEAELRRWPQAMSTVFIGLLAVESLIALALSWALFQRLSSVTIGPRLGTVRDFRFNDQWVWSIVLSIGLLLIPNVAVTRVIGMNMLVFFGALYLLRGIGVLSWLARKRIMAIALILLTALALPFAGVLAFGVGVGDTWMDWRKRLAPAS